jgi:hypothetical protein
VVLLRVLHQRAPSLEAVVESDDLLIYLFFYMLQHKTIKSVLFLEFLYGLVCLLVGRASIVNFPLTICWKTRQFYITFKLSFHIASAVDLEFSLLFVSLPWMILVCDFDLLAEVPV